MKTKEQVIREAYGDYYEKCTPDENGWFWSGNVIFGFCKKWNKLGYRQTLRFRPKSLSGIETNNGWIKIESETDLPKIGQYDMSCFELFYYADKRVIKAKYCIGLVLDITHYRLEPLIKPKPPIY